MSYEVEIEEIRPTKVVAIRSATTLPLIGSTMGAAYGELYGYIAQRGIRPAGPPTAVYTEVRDSGEVKVEICVPVSDEISGSGPVEVDELPATTALTTSHRGPYERLPDAYEALERFARSNSFQVAGPMREEYLNGPPDTPPERYETRIHLPIRKAV